MLKPSDKALVPFVSVDNMMALVNYIGLEKFIIELATEIEADFKRWSLFDKTPRVASHSDVGVIELMPTSDGEIYGFKYVNGHPKNTKEGLQTVAAFGLLADVQTGYPKILSEMTILTALRTAATSALVAKYLAPRNSNIMAMIGNGAQSEFQCIAFKAICGIDKVRLFDTDKYATEKAFLNLSNYELEVVKCKSSQEAILNADIITTCTADKQLATILTDNMVGTGIHINAIGGDCPGKTELHKDILLRSKIFVEYPPQTRAEGEIQQLEKDHPVTEIWQVMTGKSDGRTDDSQITLFDSVGFAIEDFSALKFILRIIQNTNFHEQLDMLADPNDPKDLFGMLSRANI